MWERICYRHGIVKPENKCVEIHKMCECEKCTNRRLHGWRGRNFRNALTVTVINKSKLNEVRDFVEKWKCNKDDYDGKVEYIYWQY